MSSPIPVSFLARETLNHDFYAIEGNTNPGGGRDGYEVAERGRNYSSVKKFVRLPVAAA